MFIIFVCPTSLSLFVFGPERPYWGSDKLMQIIIIIIVIIIINNSFFDIITKNID